MFCRVNAIYHPHNKTAHRPSQWLFLRLHPLNRQRYQTDTSGYNAACATLERLPAPGRPAPIQDTTATHGRCTGQRRPPIIIRYTRVRRLSWIHARQCSVSQTMPARRGLDASHARRLKVWHRSAVRAHRISLAPSTRRNSSAAGAWRAARNH